METVFGFIEQANRVFAIMTLALVAVGTPIWFLHVITGRKWFFRKPGEQK